VRTFVTGGTGFIGQHLVRLLVEQGHEVRTLARNAKKARTLPQNVDVRIGDLSDPASLEGLLDGIDVVFHLGAALQGAWERHKLITVEGTRRLLALASAAGVRRFVHVSTLAVYDKRGLRDHDVIDESSPLWEDLDRCGPYARGKIEAEWLVHELAPQRGMEYVIARPGLVYGPGHVLFEHLGIRAGGRLFLPLGGRGVRLPLVHVESVVDALARMATSPAASGRTFQIVDDAQVTKAKYLRTLGAVEGRRYRCISVPSRPLTTVAGLIERFKQSGKGAWLPSISAEKIRTRCMECRYDCSALREATGWRPRHNLEEGLGSSMETGQRVREPAVVRRVGLIGAGRIADYHIAALRRIPGMEVVGVMDRDAGAAQRLAARHGIPVACGDLDEFYHRAKPESVHVLTPPQSHAELGLDAIERGVHVLLEKPMVVTLDECDRLRAAASRKKVTVGVDHNYTADSRLVRAKRMIQSGAIGELVHLDIFWAFDIRRFHHMLPAGAGQETWATKLPGGLLEDLLPHPLSIVLALADEDLDMSSARAFRSGRLGRAFDDELRIMLAGNRSTASITLSLSASPDDLVVSMHGTRATLRLDIHNLLMTRSRLGPGPKAAARGLRLLSNGAGTLVQTVTNTARLALKRIDPPAHPYGLLREHYEALASGVALPTDLEHGRSVLELTREVWPALTDAPLDEADTPPGNRLANLLSRREGAVN
jgi:nucleoside-diphosphate-sugar epimerase/predicted dehydrogenase